VVDGQEKKVCKLLKSLYGLKQVPKKCLNNDMKILMRLYLLMVFLVVMFIDACIQSL